MAFTLVTVSATYLEPDNVTPLSGSVSFQLTGDITDGAGGRILASRRKVAVLNGSGVMSVSLAATDDATTSPQNSVYLVTENFVGVPTNTYFIEVPSASPTLNLALAAHVSLPTPYEAMLEAAIAAAEQAAEDAVEDALDDFTTGVVSVDGNTGVVDLTSTYLNQSTVQSKPGLRVSVGEPRFDVRSSAFNGGDWSSASARRATIQAAINAAVAAGGGRVTFPSLAGAVDMSGGSIIWPDVSACPRKHTQLHLEGNGIHLNTTSAHPIFTDTMPVDNSHAVTRTYMRWFNAKNFHLSGSGASANVPGQTLFRLVGNYNTEISHFYLVNSGEGGIDLIFCMGAEVKHCHGENNFGWTYRVRYGMDVDNSNAPLWSGASFTNSNGNVATFSHCEDYARVGQLGHFSIEGIDQCTLYKPIWEGLASVNPVRYVQGGSTTTKSFAVIDCHPEQAATGKHIKLVGTGGGEVTISGAAFTQGSGPIDAGEFTTGVINVDRISYLTGTNIAGGAVWSWRGAVGYDPWDAANWVGGTRPTYKLPTLRGAVTAREGSGLGSAPTLDFPGAGHITTDQTLTFHSLDISPKLLTYLTKGVSIGLWNAQANTATQGNDSVFLWKDETTGAIVFVVKDSAGTVYTVPLDYKNATLLSAAKVQTVVPTSSYTLVLTDVGKVIEMNVAGANTLTVPPNSSVAIPVGSVMEFHQYGAGQTTVTPGAGVTLRGTKLKTTAQYSSGTLRKRATDEWVVAGDLTV